LPALGGGGELNVEADEVIAATGWTCPLQDLDDIGVARFGRSLLPSMTNYWGERDCARHLLRGTIGQGSAA
jgi:hypothetical protein